MGSLADEKMAQQMETGCLGCGSVPRDDDDDDDDSCKMVVFDAELYEICSSILRAVCEPTIHGTHSSTTNIIRPLRKFNALRVGWRRASLD